MQQWEYLIIFVASIKDTMRVTVENGHHLSQSGVLGVDYGKCPKLDAYAKQRGEEGWEMVGMAATEPGLLHVAFKRPKTY